MDIAQMTDTQIAAALDKSDYPAIQAILADFELTDAQRAELDAAS